MGMRVTTGMAMNTYRYNLQLSTSNKTNSMNKVLSHRQFDSFSANPSSALQAWRVRRAMADNASYQKNNNDTYSRFSIASATMGLIKTELEKAGTEADIRGSSDSTASARIELGKILKDTGDSVIQAMNSAKYGDHFVFSGDDEMNAPFSWDGDKLLYRGVNVNAGLVANPADPKNIPSWAKDEDGNVVGLRQEADLPAGMPESSEDPNEQAWIEYYKDQKKVKEDPAYTPVTTKPTSAVPSWAQDPADQTGQTAIELKLEDKVPEGMPTSSTNDVEQAWIDYYNGLKAGNPVIKPSDPPGAAWGEPDKYGVPEAAKDVDETHDAYNRAWAAYYLDQADVQRLEKLNGAYENVDLGMGLQEDENGKLIDGTAFDRSLPGIQMLGYGIDQDGDPKNIVMIMRRLGEIFSGCDSETGVFSKNEEENKALREEADRLMNKLKDATNNTNRAYTDIDTKAHYLKENQSRLKMQGDYLQEERANLEDVDLADALTEFSWDYYCYSAALKVGTQLLSQSLIDYMN